MLPSYDKMQCFPQYVAVIIYSFVLVFGTCCQMFLEIALFF